MRSGAGRHFGAQLGRIRVLGQSHHCGAPYGLALAAINKSTALAAAHLLQLTQPWRRNYSFILIAA